MATLSRTWTTAGRVGRVGNLPVRPILATLLLLIILAAAAFWAFTTGLLGQRQAAVTYQSAPVSRGNVVSSIAATGPITSPVSLPLTFKSSGKLVELQVKIGDKVTVGQVLAQLDTADLEAQVAQAQATLAQNQANYDKLAQGP